MADSVGSYGRHMVNVLVGPDEVPFTVYQDLICASSGYLEELQSSRKAIEGECSICAEGMSGHSPVTFCGECGQNFHTKCVQRWFDTEDTCPLCRLDWEHDEDEIDVLESSLDEGDPLSFDMYMQWLYTGTIPSYPHGDVENAVQNRFIEFFRVHMLGDKLQDPGFLKAVREEITNHTQTAEALPNEEAIRFACTNASEASVLRKFLADLCALRVSSRFSNTEGYPKQFVNDMLRALLSRRGHKSSLRKSLAEWLPEEEGKEDQEREGPEAAAA